MHHVQFCEDSELKMALHHQRAVGGERDSFQFQNRRILLYLVVPRILSPSLIISQSIYLLTIAFRAIC